MGRKKVPILLTVNIQLRTGQYNALRAVQKALPFSVSVTDLVACAVTRAVRVASGLRIHRIHLEGDQRRQLLLKDQEGSNHEHPMILNLLL